MTLLARMIENSLLWIAYHLLRLARAHVEAEAVARRCVDRHGLPGDYIDLITVLHAQGKDTEARAWLAEFERTFPRLRRLYQTTRLRRLMTVPPR